MSTQSKRFGKPEIILAAVLLVLSLGALLVITNESLAAWNLRLFNTWTSWAVTYGYLGAFLTALVGNLTVVIIFPYTILIFFLATTGLNPWLLGLVTGLGAELGELSGFFLGRIGAGAVERRRPQEYAALKSLIERRPAFIPVLLFVFSLTPMPDDVLFIPLGMLRYPTWKLIVPSLLGKICAGLIIALSGRTLETALETAAIRQAWLYQFGALALLAILMYAIAKVPWNSMLRRLIGPTSTKT